MPCKSREYGLHPKLSFPANDLFLKLSLRVNPGLRQGTVNSVDVAHAVPWQMGGAREEASDFVVGEAVLFPDLLPDGFLSGYCKRHVHPVQRHPVDEALPVLPLPPYHGIAEGAVVKEKPLRHKCFRADCLFGHRHFLRAFHGLRCIPGDVYSGFVQISAQTRRQRIRTVPLDEDAALSCRYFIEVLFACYFLEFYFAGILRNYAPRQLPCGFFAGR